MVRKTVGIRFPSHSREGTNHLHGWFFLLCFHLVQGSRFKVQGSGGGFAAFLEEDILDTKPSPRGEGGEQSEPDRVLAV